MGAMADPAPDFDEPFEAQRPSPGSRLLQGPDLRALEQAADQLRAAYRRLSPGLRDPERRTLRYWRTQQRLGWIVATYGALLPEEVVARVHARAGRSYLANAFDESAPSRRAVLNLRALTREVLAAVEAALDAAGRRLDPW